MNKKGDILSGQTVIAIICVLFIVAAAFAFTKPLLEWGGGSVQKLGFNFGTEETTTQTIDEERIDAGSIIKINAVTSDKESGIYWIKKQAYGLKWNLEYDEEKQYIKYQAGQISVSQLRNQEQRTLLSQQTLPTILSSDKVRGSISANGKIYVHIPTQPQEQSLQFQWFEDSDADAVYTAGTDSIIQPDALSQLILADLFNSAGGAKS